jgi:hypothetical protein
MGLEAIKARIREMEGESARPKLLHLKASQKLNTARLKILITWQILLQFPGS